MAFRGGIGDSEPSSDLAIPTPGGDEGQHLAFAPGQHEDVVLRAVHRVVVLQLVDDGSDEVPGEPRLSSRDLLDAANEGRRRNVWSENPASAGPEGCDRGVPIRLIDTDNDAGTPGPPRGLVRW